MVELYLHTNYFNSLEFILKIVKFPNINKLTDDNLFLIKIVLLSIKLAVPINNSTHTVINN